MQEYKGYNLGQIDQSTLIKVLAKGQGAVPKPLKGTFTSEGEAKKHIDSYLRSLLKGGKNGKTKSRAAS